jgi:hypothetical protein
LATRFAFTVISVISSCCISAAKTRLFRNSRVSDRAAVWALFDINTFQIFAWQIEIAVESYVLLDSRAKKKLPPKGSGLSY